MTIREKINNKYIRFGEPLDTWIYKTIKHIYRNSTKEKQQKVLNWMPDCMARFDLTSYFRSLHKNK